MTCSKTFSIAIWAFCASCLLFLYGCGARFQFDKRLEVQWQLMEITLPDGSISNPEAQYVSFASRIVNLYDPLGSMIGGNMVYDTDYQVLTLNFHQEEGLWLGAWGIMSETPVTVVYHVEELSKSQLILRQVSNNTILKYRKF